MSVKQLLGFSLGSLVVLLLGSVAFTTHTLNSQKSDGLQINLAGRQRMLSQRLTKEALSIGAATDDESRAHWREAFTQTAGLFDRTVSALLDGGTTVGGTGQDVTLPTATDEDVRARLNEGIALWRSLQPAVAVLSDPATVPGSPEYQAALAELGNSNIPLLKLMNAATGAFQAASDAKVARLAIIQKFSIALALVLAGFAFWSVHRHLVTPLQSTLQFARVIADGNLKNTLAVRGSREINELAAAMNGMSGNLRETVGVIAATAGNLDNSAAALFGNSENISGSTAEVARDLNTVGSAVEEMSASMQSFVGSTADIDESIATVAAAVEEMSSSMIEVSGSTQNAAGITKRAAGIVENTTALIHDLDKSADEISKVVQLINEVADQTNLLALNATIEAASAGEAGKGFAVVANEVKDLAKQTNQATEDIRNRVDGIQVMSQRVSTSIGEVADIIAETTAISEGIAEAVTQQSVATQEISGSIQRTAGSASFISHGIGEVSQAINDISGSLQRALGGVNGINQSINELSGTDEAASTEGSTSAKGLTVMSKSLNEAVSNFQT